MAWSKDAANTSTYLDYGVVPISGSGARTIVHLFKTTTTANSLAGWGTDSSLARFGWKPWVTASFAMQISINGGNFYGSTTGLNDGVWHIAAFGIPAGGAIKDAEMCVDGNVETITYSSDVNINTGTDNNLFVGYDASGAAPSGAIAEHGGLAIYDRMFGSAELLAASKVFNPGSNPRGLIIHSPLIREFQDLMGLATITEQGGANASISAHPVINQPAAPQILQFPPVAAAAGRVMSSLAGYGGLAGHGGIAGPHGGLAG